MASEKAVAGVATQFLGAFVANLISLNTGYVVGWSAVAIPVLENNGTANDTAPLDRPLTKDESSWVATVLFIAWIAGPAACSFISQRWGYKVAGYLVGTISAMAGVIIMLAPSLATMLVGRVLTGFAAGCTPVVTTTYITEAAQEHIRGAVGTFFGLLFNGGILIAYLMGAVASYQIVCAMAVILPIVYLLGFFFLPESPQYLLSKGRDGDAVKSLRWFRTAGHNVSQELEQLRSNLDSGASENGGRGLSVVQFFKDRTCRLGFITVVMVILNQQFAGVTIALNYLVQMFSATGNSSTAAWSAVVVGALQFLATFVSSALVDRAGRRPLLMATNGGMAACLLALGGYSFAQDRGSDVASVWWLPVAAMSLLLFLNAIGVGPLFFVIVNELFAPEAAPVGVSIGLGCQMLVATFVMKSYVILVDWLQLYGCYWFFSTCCILSNVYIFFFLPETKNRPISEILRDLRRERRNKNEDAEKYDQVSTKECHKQVA
ncbi:facilitated trehalose transporter Tret1-like [Schistocerca nitens]|uniref:facilitated trehalose transporter Tret1-like n=1 Tax=Schistocerca nitens TaxID=7011 RepID=UPI00211831E4|nr:facilitated trehalose transporter Tret1-like [Schistocerca nitens]